MIRDTEKEQRHKEKDSHLLLKAQEFARVGWLPNSQPFLFLGIYRKPSLLALPAPLVKSGGAVTLKCYSEIVFETFSLVLHRKGLSMDPLYLVGEPCDGGYQANISIAPVTSEHTGTYRCYGFVSLQPYEWSDPSDSLDIKITGENMSILVHHPLQWADHCKFSRGWKVDTFWVQWR